MRKYYLLAVLMSSALGALPTGEQVASGEALVARSVDACQITQVTPQATIHWDSFSIAAQEAVRFIQPSSNSVVVNRVMGTDLSHIAGSMSGNGHIFLINPNGVIFAPGSQVNAAGFVASTLSMLDSQEGSYSFQGVGGTVLNQGLIQANGSIALIGGRVINEGRLEVSKGVVSLAAGSEVSLALNERGSLFATVKQESLQALVDNQGYIQAPGGTVILSALSSSTLLETVVNNSGVVAAKSLSYEEGRIILRGGKSGIVENKGTLDVSGENKGGNVSIMGQYVGQQKNAQIVATGASQGGQVTLGIDQKELAKRTYIAKESLIDASSAKGDAGSIIIWSSDNTIFHGTLLAEAPEGKGGFIETSSQSGFQILGNISTFGKVIGTWSLDPTTLQITQAPPPLSTGNFSGGAPHVWTDDTNASSTLDCSDINIQLTNNNVVLDTGSGSDTGIAQITIPATTPGIVLEIPAGHYLTLSAHNNT
ncbi:MAG: filamentous hemagglutinin N-terminal domain-containing protein, partial [Chlamydiota bacterium]